MEPKKPGHFGYVRNGYTVLIGPNRKNPSLVDAVVINTKTGLMGINPEIAQDAINSLVDKMPHNPNL